MTKYGCIWNTIKLTIGVAALAVLIVEAIRQNPVALALLGGLIATALIVGVFIMFMLISKQHTQQQIAVLQANAQENSNLLKSMSDALKLSAVQLRHAQQLTGYHPEGQTESGLPPAYQLAPPQAEETPQLAAPGGEVVEGHVIHNDAITFDTSKFQG